MIKIEFSERQLKIIEIVKKHEPITGENIASILALTRGALRPDLAILTMLNILEAKPKIGYFYNKEYSGLIKRNIGKVKVKDLKSLPVVVTKNTRIYDAAVTMFVENEIDCLPVIEEKHDRLKVIGKISKTNIVSYIYDTLI